MSAPPGQPFTLEHFEWWANHLILDTGNYWELEDFHRLMLQPLLDGITESWTIIPESNTKAECVHTRLPTPDGWTTMLEVQPGDELLGSDGLPVRVTHVSEVKFGEDCYRIKFSDGAEDVVGGDHRWVVEDANSDYLPKVRSTRWLYNRPVHLKKSRGFNAARWRIRNGCRRIGPEVELLIEPYVLGVWLGDGDSRGGVITNIDEGVWCELESITALNEPFNLSRPGAAMRRTVCGLQTRLKASGLYGNKHIPEAYLLAPEEDRWRLLQGLMDTDGCVSKGGQAVYNSTNTRLINDVRRLCWSLGLSAFLNESRAILDGVDCGPSYRLTIACDQRHPLVLLERKRSRLKRISHTADHRRITSIDRVQSVPVKCVSVDALDQIYLTTDAYIPTHNTTTMGGFGLYHGMHVRAPWVPIVASSRDQAEIMAQQMYAMIRATPGLEWNKKTRTGYFEILEGYRQIRCYHSGVLNGGRGIKVYAADVATSDGGIPTLVLCDEGHRWPSMGPYRLWKGKLGKRSGQIAMISTAGEPGGEFEEMRDTIREKATERELNGAHGVYRGHNIVLNEWAVRNTDDITNMEKVKEANPFSGITVETLQEHFDSPTTDLGDWRRLKCNVPSRTITAAITEAEWDKAAVAAEIPEGERIDVGCDVAWKHDTFAIAPLWQDREEGYRLLGAPTILTPPRDGSTMHPDEPKRAFEAIMDRNPIDAVVIDLERAEDIAAWLEDECGIAVIDRTQSNALACADYDAFMKGLRTGTLRHTGDPGLRRHVMNAIARQLPGEKKRFDRPSQSRARRKQVVRVIDALTAAAMVNQYLDEFVDMSEPLVAWR